MDGLREALAKALADITVSFIADVCKHVARQLPRELEDDESPEWDEYDYDTHGSYCSHSHDPSFDRQTDSKSNACVICLDNEKCCFVSPCMHLCICINCANTLIELGDTLCPICRIKIKDIRRVYV